MNKGWSDSELVFDVWDFFEDRLALTAEQLSPGEKLRFWSEESLGGGLSVEVVSPLGWPGFSVVINSWEPHQCSSDRLRELGWSLRESAEHASPSEVHIERTCVEARDVADALSIVFREGLGLRNPWFMGLAPADYSACKDTDEQDGHFDPQAPMSQVDLLTSVGISLRQGYGPFVPMMMDGAFLVRSRTSDLLIRPDHEAAGVGFSWTIDTDIHESGAADSLVVQLNELSPFAHFRAEDGEVRAWYALPADPLIPGHLYRVINSVGKAIASVLEAARGDADEVGEEVRDADEPVLEPLTGDIREELISALETMRPGTSTAIISAGQAPRWMVTVLRYLDAGLLLRLSYTGPVYGLSPKAWDTLLELGWIPLGNAGATGPARLMYRASLLRPAEAIDVAGLSILLLEEGADAASVRMVDPEDDLRGLSFSQSAEFDVDSFETLDFLVSDSLRKLGHSGEVTEHGSRRADAGGLPISVEVDEDRPLVRINAPLVTGISDEQEASSVVAELLFTGLTLVLAEKELALAATLEAERYSPAHLEIILQVFEDLLLSDSSALAARLGGETPTRAIESNSRAED